MDSKLLGAAWVVLVSVGMPVNLISRLND
jgi:hypothetical protein